MSAMLIDVGNTRIKWSNQDLTNVSQRSHQSEDLLEVLAPTLAREEPPSAIYIGSVASEKLTNELVRWCREQWQVEVYSVSATDDLPGFVNGYRRPEQLGVDRVLVMLAAQHQADGAYCVVDSGTATTIDVVNADGLHMGGYILPGLDMMRESLFQNTSIPQDTFQEYRDIIGRDTASGVALASRYAVVALVERLIEGKHALLPQDKVQLFLTGGNADVLAPLFSQKVARMDFMVLQGLAVLANRSSD